MTVTIMRDGVTAKDDKGNVYRINALVLKRNSGLDATYSTSDHFFKVACPYNTKHEATFLDDERVNLH